MFRIPIINVISSLADDYKWWWFRWRSIYSTVDIKDDTDFIRMVQMTLDIQLIHKIYNKWCDDDDKSDVDDRK